MGHTAVVTKAYSGGGIEVREQNPDKCGKSVYHPGSKTAGSVTIYRMSSSSTEDAPEYESLGQGQCVDAAGQEVSYYHCSYFEGWHEVSYYCQEVCDADDECVAFRDSTYKGYNICVLYAPSRSSAAEDLPGPYRAPLPTWGWEDLSHDSVTKAWHNPYALAKEQDCMLKKAA